MYIPYYLGVISSLSCDFEDGSRPLCDLQQAPASVDTFDWIRFSGKTATPRTGPEGDHTEGKQGRGQYYMCNRG